jgi:predicted unusual protein kinase regulating ubiquinone biosynthesis (AarF/ABC1/UbiB family)
MLRSGQICLSFLYNYLTSETKADNNGNLSQKVDKLKILSDTFSSHGGILSKISQIMCTEEYDSSVFSDCKPFSRDKTIKYLKNEYKNNIELFKNVVSLDFKPFKSGSVGQVHKGIYKIEDENDKDIIIKMQYVGLEEQVKTDLFILDKVISFLYNGTMGDISNAIIDIKTKLYEELDYNNEFLNQKCLYDIWFSHKNIDIAQLVPELCNEKMLGMHFIEGESLTEFIINATQEEKNKIGMLIVEFIFTNFYQNGLFYSDIHYGNFLVKDRNILYVMDFGCLHEIEDRLLNNLILLHKALLEEDKEKFYNLVKTIGIIKEDISEKSKIYIYDYFRLQYEPYISNDFEFTNEWLEKAIFKDSELMKEWTLPPNMVYLNKIPYGLSHILTKLNLRGDFKDFFDSIM